MTLDRSPLPRSTALPPTLITEVLMSSTPIDTFNTSREGEREVTE